MEGRLPAQQTHQGTRGLLLGMQKVRISGSPPEGGSWLGEQANTQESLTKGNCWSRLRLTVLFLQPSLPQPRTKI